MLGPAVNAYVPGMSYGPGPEGYPEQPKAAMDAPAVRNAADRLERSIDILTKLMDELSGRLNAVRSQTTAGHGAERNVPVRPGNSPVAIHMHTQSERIDSVCQHINHILGELEI